MRKLGAIGISLYSCAHKIVMIVYQKMVGESEAFGLAATINRD